MKAQADGFAFDSALNTAILGKKGRSVKAVRALLDLDALKAPRTAAPTLTRLWTTLPRPTPGPLVKTVPPAWPWSLPALSMAHRPPTNPMVWKPPLSP